MKDIFLELVETSFKMRYKGSVLGFIWVLIKPFSIFLLLFLVFSKLNQGTSELNQYQFSIYLLVGIVFFTLFNEGILWGMGSLMEKSNIILKINFPRPVAVASSISLAVINFVINTAIITILCIAFGVIPSVSSLLYILLVVASMLLFISGISLFLSILLVRLRDLTHIFELVMQLIFYGSAIFYPIEIIPEQWRWLIMYNPVGGLVYAVRQALLFNEIVLVKYVLLFLGIGVVLLILGFRYFNTHIKKIAEYF